MYGYKWYFCATTGNQNLHGMAMACDESYHHLIQQVELISPELLYTIMKSEHAIIAIINVYAPQSGLVPDYDRSAYQSYLAQVRNAIVNIRRTYSNTISTQKLIFIILGDLNARLGRGETDDFHDPMGSDYGGILGPRLPSEPPSPSGEELLVFCSDSNINGLPHTKGFIVANSREYLGSSYQDAQFGTWTHFQIRNGVKYTSAIDHILIDEDSFNLVTSCGIEPTTHDQDESDHRLMYITIDLPVQPRNLERQKNPQSVRYQWPSVYRDEQFQTRIKGLVQEAVSSELNSLPPNAPSSMKS